MVTVGAGVGCGSGLDVGPLLGWGEGLGDGPRVGGGEGLGTGTGDGSSDGSGDGGGAGSVDGVGVGMGTGSADGWSVVGCELGWAVGAVVDSVGRGDGAVEVVGDGVGSGERVGLEVSMSTVRPSQNSGSDDISNVTSPRSSVPSGEEGERRGREEKVRAGRERCDSDAWCGTQGACTVLSYRHCH